MRTASASRARTCLLLLFIALAAAVRPSLGQGVIVNRQPIPLDLYFVLDASGSIASYDPMCMATMRMSCFAVIVNFVQEIIWAIAPLAGGVNAQALRVGLCAFSCNHVGPVTRKINGLLPIDNSTVLNQSLALLSTYVPNGGTCPSGAFGTILANLQAVPAGAALRQTAVFIITDGLINTVDSSRSIAAAAAIRQAGASFFACAIGDLSSAPDRSRQHYELLAETGNPNNIFRVGNADALSKIVYILSALTLDAFSVAVYQNDGCFNDSLVLSGPSVGVLAGQVGTTLYCLISAQDGTLISEIAAVPLPDGTQICSLPSILPVYFSAASGTHRSANIQLLIEQQSSNITLASTIRIDAPVSPQCIPSFVSLPCQTHAGLPLPAIPIPRGATVQVVWHASFFTVSPNTNGSLLIESSQTFLAQQCNVSWCPGPVAIGSLGVLYSMDLLAVAPNVPNANNATLLAQGWPAVFALQCTTDTVSATLASACYGQPSPVQFQGSVWPSALCWAIVDSTLIPLGTAPNCFVPFGLHIGGLVLSDAAGLVQMIETTVREATIDVSGQCGSLVVPANLCFGAPYPLDFQGPIFTGAITVQNFACEFLQAKGGGWTAAGKCFAPALGERAVRLVDSNGTVALNLALSDTAMCASITSETTLLCPGTNVSISFAGLSVDSLGKTGLRCDFSIAGSGQVLWQTPMENSQCSAPFAALHSLSSAVLGVSWQGQSKGSWLVELQEGGDSCFGILASDSCLGQPATIHISKLQQSAQCTFTFADVNQSTITVSVLIDASSSCIVPSFVPPNALWTLLSWPDNETLLQPAILPYNTLLCDAESIEFQGLCINEYPGLTLSTNPSNFDAAETLLSCAFTQSVGSSDVETSVVVYAPAYFASNGSVVSCTSPVAWSLPQGPFTSVQVLVNNVSVWSTALSAQGCWSSFSALCQSSTVATALVQFVGAYPAGAVCAWSDGSSSLPLRYAEGSFWCAALSKVESVQLSLVQTVLTVVPQLPDSTGYCLNVIAAQCGPPDWYTFSGFASPLVASGFNSSTVVWIAPDIQLQANASGLACVPNLGATGPPSALPVTGTAPSSAASMTLVLGSAMGGVALVGCAFFAGFALRKRRRLPNGKNLSEDPLAAEAEAEAARIMVAWKGGVAPVGGMAEPSDLESSASEAATPKFLLSDLARAWISLPFALFAAKITPPDDTITVAQDVEGEEVGNHEGYAITFEAVPLLGLTLGRNRQGHVVVEDTAPGGPLHLRAAVGDRVVSIDGVLCESNFVLARSLVKGAVAGKRRRISMRLGFGPVLSVRIIGSGERESSVGRGLDFGLDLKDDVANGRVIVSHVRRAALASVGEALVGVDGYPADTVAEVMRRLRFGDRKRPARLRFSSLGVSVGVGDV